LGVLSFVSSQAHRLIRVTTGGPLEFAPPLPNSRLDCTADQSDAWVAMEVETKFLRKPAALVDRINGFRVSWIGGWDKGRVVSWS